MNTSIQDPRRVIVTGGAGFIGSHVVRRLVKSNCHVLNFDCLTYAGNLNNLSDVCEDPKYTFQLGDVRNSTAVRDAFKLFKPHAVIHAAAESHVDRSIARPDDFVSTNVVGTYNLLKAAQDYVSEGDVAIASFRFLHVSTDEVFGSLTGTDQPADENANYQPNSPYSATKASSDHLVRAWNETYGLPTFITRSTNNYGPNQLAEKLVPVIISRAFHGMEIPIYGTGENVRDWLYVEDHAHALMRTLEEGQPGDSYNIGANCEFGNLELAKKLCTLMDEKLPCSENPRIKHRSVPCTSYCQLLSFVSDRPGHDFRYALNCSKIRKQLAWEPEHTLEMGLRKTIDWYFDNPDWMKIESQTNTNTSELRER